jgi:APA family basic amino acid/polyamine antiporter
LKKLVRSLGPVQVVAISISSMLGSGIFVLPAIAVAQTGPSVWLAYLVASLCVLPAAISKSELATAMPTSGGSYVYVERTFGPMAGTIAGLGLFLSLLLKSAFSLVGFGAYLMVIADVSLKQTAMISLAFIIFLNIFGVGKMSTLLIAIVTISIATLFGLAGYSLPDINMTNLEPFFEGGSLGFLGATGIVFISYAGVTKVAAIAEEIRKPEKNLPFGILVSLGIVTLIYAVISFIMVSVMGSEKMAGSLKPIYLLAETVGGKNIALFASVIAVITMISMANAGILAASRFPFAMSRDHLLPSFISKISKRFLTPVNAIILSGVVVFCILAFLNITKIAKLASAFKIILFVIVHVSVIVLRESRTQWYNPTYKSPLYPFFQIFGIITGIILLLAMGQIVLSAVVVVTIPGAIFYFAYSRRRTSRKGVIGIRGRRTDLTEEDPDRAEVMESMDLSMEATVVTSLFGNERSPEMLIEMGAALSDGGNLEVTHVTEVPEQTELRDLVEESAELKSLRRRVVAMAMHQNISLTFDPIASYDLAKTLYEISQRLHCNWMLIEWAGRRKGYFTFHDPIGWLKGHLQCNLGVFRDAGVRYIRKIMVVVNFDDNDTLVVDTADHLAMVNKADITLVYFKKEAELHMQAEETESRLYDLTTHCHSRSFVQVISGRDEMDTLLNYSAEFDLLIFGSKEHGLISKVFGTNDDYLIEKAACSVLAVNSARHQSDEAEKSKDS